MDKLDEIFAKQARLQSKLGYGKAEIVFAQKFLNMNILACVDELMEILRETRWKPWKKGQSLNVDKIRFEIADLLHFFVNLCLFADIGAKELYDLYAEKNSVNLRRISENY